MLQKNKKRLEMDFIDHALVTARVALSIMDRYNIPAVLAGIIGFLISKESINAFCLYFL